ncbi:MAG: hypothetical protein U1D96_03375 [Eubacteriales bacterium]|nr:hypothetical protein [Clostridia bacterium]MDZ4042518.1 hypothetical protein [Eubacteriales bacterium]MDZ7610691.1 hypothetical protein [Eubacteriales bacterium]
MTRPSSAALSVPIYAHIETDESDLDAFRLAACAAADWVATDSEEALRSLAISLAVFSAHWSRRSVSGARVEVITRMLQPGARVCGIT